MSVWDVVGQGCIRVLWRHSFRLIFLSMRHHFHNTHCHIVVVDAAQQSARGMRAA
jgi:hypothetical protein